MAGAAMLRVGGAAIYEITYVDEATARAVAKARPAHPLGTWSARRLGLLPELERASPAGYLAEPDDDEDPEEAF